MGCSFSKPELVSKQQTGSNPSNIQERNIKEQKIDNHTQKAPDSVKQSPEALVNYMLSASKDPRMLARGFFVWSSENIKYDVEGFFGRAKMASCDATSVIKNGRSVCEGYANVFALLCRKAKIPVKKISGFAKGYGYSPKKIFNLNSETDHAWNAVQLEGKWYLLDSTWGAGHLDPKTDSFEKKFNDFYFLTEPKQFVSRHFPYMDNNLGESQKWQLLSMPVSLEEFNINVCYEQAAYKLGAVAVSHPYGYFEMKNELLMTFKSAHQKDMAISARLMLKEENRLKEQTNRTFCFLENGVSKLLVHPSKRGTYELDIFGKLVSDESVESKHLMTYTIDCTEVKNETHEYPISYTEKCILHEPMRGNLPANTDVKFCVYAPHLQTVMVEHTYLEKSGTMFTGNVKTHAAGYKVNMFGTKGDRYSRMQAMFGFHTV